MNNMNNEMNINIEELFSNGIKNGNLPAPEEITFYKLVNERRIVIDGEVDDRMIEYTRMLMVWNMEDRDIPKEERKPIWLYIHNFGGDVQSMWSFIDMIDASITPVYTVNIGVCASAAALIFISGHKRFMMPKATVTIHEGSAQLEGDAVKVFDAANSYKETIRKMKEFILERTSIPKTMLNKKRNNDWEIDAKYCLENNVCHVVVENMNDILA